MNAKPKKRRWLPGEQHAFDLTIPCPAKQCGAAVGEPCHGLVPPMVHFGRRLKRMQAGVR